MVVSNFIVLLLLLIQGGQEPAILNHSESRVPFSIESPDLKLELSNKLKEISGLTWYQDNLLAAVQDEDGIVFILDATTGKITQSLRFGPGGDYESIEYVRPFFYALTSSGKLYQIYHEDPSITVATHTTLNWLNDVEGMAFDPDTYALLLGCKEQPSSVYYDDPKGKAIYGYNLFYDSLLAPPRYLLKKKDLEPFIGEKIKFKPSAVAIDPIDCNIYTLASVGKLLIVLSPDGTVIEVIKLKNKQFRQPEAITFSPQGDLYIGNEASGKKAILYKFSRKSD